MFFWSVFLKMHKTHAPKFWNWTSKLIPDLWLLDLFCPINIPHSTLLDSSSSLSITCSWTAAAAWVLPVSGQYCLSTTCSWTAAAAWVLHLTGKQQQLEYHLWLAAWRCWHHRHTAAGWGRGGAAAAGTVGTHDDSSSPWQNHSLEILVWKGIKGSYLYHA